MSNLFFISHLSLSHATALAGQRLDLVVKFLVFGIELTYFAQQFQLAVHIVAHILVEQLEVMQYLLTRIDLRILAQCGVESLQLQECVLIESYLAVAFL